jgi:hypothetical protein
MAMKSFVLIFDDATIGEKALFTILENLPEVRNWVSYFAGSAFLVSKLGADELAAIIEDMFPNGLFLLAEFNASKASGLIDEEAWEFLAKPRKA